MINFYCMMQECLNKVLKRLETLSKDEVTKDQAYISQQPIWKFDHADGKMCFNAIVLDICKGIKANNYRNSEVPDVLDHLVYERSDTRKEIDYIHMTWINGHIRFNTAIKRIKELLIRDNAPEP